MRNRRRQVVNFSDEVRVVVGYNYAGLTYEYGECCYSDPMYCGGCYGDGDTYGFGGNGRGQGQGHGAGFGDGDGNGSGNGYNNDAG